VSKLAYVYFLLLCPGQVHLFGYIYLYWLLANSAQVVTCEGGGIYLFSYNPLPSQNLRSPGTSPLGLTSLNRKNLPIEVTLGGIGSSCTSLTLHIYLYRNYKLCDNRVNSTKSSTKLTRTLDRVISQRVALCLGSENTMGR
jgi:hypothetical protein